MKKQAGGRQRLAVRVYRWASIVLYEQLAWAYDAVSWVVSLGRWATWRRAALPLVAGPAVELRVLDLGFGTGELMSEMSQRGLHPYGLEPSPAMHRVTARKLRRRSLSVPRVRARAQAMPFADHSFDSAVSTFPAWYILDQVTLNEVARVIGRRGSSCPENHARFVVVGLFTGMSGRTGSRSGAGLLSGTDQRILDHFRPLAEQAGFDLEVVASDTGGWRPPVAVLTRR